MTHRERAIDQIAGIITDHMQAAIQFECEDSPLGWSAWLESKRAEVQEQNDGDGFTFDAIFGDEGPNSWTRVQGASLNAADLDTAWQRGLAWALA